LSLDRYIRWSGRVEETISTDLIFATHAKIAEMRAQSWDKVFTAARTDRINASPIVDGYFLPKYPKAIFGSGQQNDVPIIVGWTSNDIGANPPIRGARTLEEYTKAANEMYGSKAPELLSLFPAADDAAARKQSEVIGRLSGFGAQARTWAKEQATTGQAPAYLYLFSRSHSHAPNTPISNLDPRTAGAS
jgi:para-nitrobenzyl esterase